MSKLFVYGIFLNKHNRESFSMTNPRYATVRGYATKGGTIVTAYPAKGYTLSGLIVNIPDTVLAHTSNGLEEISNWRELDLIESGYDRISVRTTDNEECWMYVASTQPFWSFNK